MGLRDDSTPPVGLGEPFEVWLLLCPMNAFPTFAEAKLYVETKIADSFPLHYVEIRSPRDRTVAWVCYDGTVLWDRSMPTAAK